jgi:hypothetical protein
MKGHSGIESGNTKRNGFQKEALLIVQTAKVHEISYGNDLCCVGCLGTCREDKEL